MATTSAYNDGDAVRDRVESFISYGRPKCDVCYDTHRDERPDAAEFSPERVIHYVDASESAAFAFWGTSLCPYHDTTDHIPDEATHRIVDEPEYVGDTHRMNSAYTHTVTGVEQR